MANSFQEWLQQGEDLYSAAMREYHDIERQLSDLEARLVEKQNEVNQIAQVIGKPLVEGTRRLTRSSWPPRSSTSPPSAPPPPAPTPTSPAP